MATKNNQDPLRAFFTKYSSKMTEPEEILSKSGLFVDDLNHLRLLSVGSLKNIFKFATKKKFRNSWMLHRIEPRRKKFRTTNDPIQSDNWIADYNNGRGDQQSRLILYRMVSASDNGWDRKASSNDFEKHPEEHR